MDLNKIQHLRNLHTYLILLALLVIGITTHAFIPLLDGACLIIRLIIGLLGLIFLPGFVLTIIALDDKNANVGFSLILGFLLQLFNIYAIWAFHIFYGPVNFVFLVYVLTIIEVVSLIIVSYKRKLTLGIDKLLNALKTDKDLIVLVFIYLALAFYWQQWAPAPHSDGAAYLDMARNVVEKGSFHSNMLYPTTTWSYVECSSGMHIHMFGYFAIALFFLLGNISLLSGKIMLIFTGLLIILVVYELARELFNTNVARLAALITAVSPEILTHVGLVGGPEIPSALFTIFAIYLLIKAPTSKRKLSLGSVAGLSLFVACYAWYFNFFVFVTFLPFLFIYVSMKNREFKVTDSLVFLTLLLSFIVEWRLLLNLFYAIIGIQIPSLIIAVSALTYLYHFKKEKAGKTLLTFAVMMLMLYFAFYSRVIASDFIPQLQQFVASVQPGIKVVTSNVEQDIGVLSRAFSLEEVNKYWSMYWDGVYGFLGIVVVFLGFVALARIDKIKETALIISFPLLQALWWGLFVIIDGFQPRYIVCSSLFYFILAASTIEMVCSYALANLNIVNKLRVNLKVKPGKIIHDISTRGLVASFVIILVLGSFFNSTFALYDKHKKVMEGWNYPEYFGWHPAIEWIRDNTSVNDVIMSRSANYFAWYTGRKIAWPPIDSNTKLWDLVNAIKYYRANYLLLDERTYSLYPNIRGLYTEPKSFLGAYPVFISNYFGHKVVIYNVTNIAYGELRIEEKLLLSVDQIERVKSNPYYTEAAIIEKDASERINGSASIRVTATIKDVPDPSSAIIISVETLNMTDYDYLVFWIKAPNSTQIGFVIMQDSNNYYIYPRFGLTSSEWEKIVIPIKAHTSMYGAPSLSKISNLRIYVLGRTPREQYTFWLGPIYMVREGYVL
jgi:hypothetical protein